jgi:hypothetical protein
MKRLVGYVLLLVVLVGLVYLILTYVPVHQILAQPVAQNPGTQITVAHINDATSTYTVNVQYPQVGIPAIDAQIKTTVQDAVAEFETTPPNPPDSATPQNSFTGTFDSLYIGPDVVSVKLVLSQYTGGAHDLTVINGLNYDRATGKALTLDDALKITGLSLDQLAASAATQLKASLGDAFMFPDGASANRDNFNSFVISADKVTFIFQEYQVAPYSEGIQHVSFPRAVAL